MLNSQQQGSNPQSNYGCQLNAGIAIASVAAIIAHLLLRFVWSTSAATTQMIPLWFILVAGGGPLVVTLVLKLIHKQFGSDLLAGLSILTAVLSGEYLTGAMVVLMLSGGQALEAYAVGRASSALRALAGRVPSLAHRRVGGQIAEVSINELKEGDEVVIFPHETCPVDGTVIEGVGSMDESFLTGEAFRLPKITGTAVISGATNGEAALVVQVTHRPADSRYAKILEVMRRAETERPQMRRLADQLGSFYTPLAVLVAIVAWVATGESSRFLAVLVIATPCPLLIAIPVSIIGAISLCARRGIIIKDPAALERVSKCRTAIFDKTGTLTYGRPALATETMLGVLQRPAVLGFAAALERYSKHPLAFAVVEAAAGEGISPPVASEVSEPPGHGLQGVVEGHRVEITGRPKLRARMPDFVDALPPSLGGLECVVLVDDVPAALLSFRDEPRLEAAEFVSHLRSKHRFQRTVIASGDRRAEVAYLAERMGVDVVYAEQSPEQKVSLVRAETAAAPTMYIGDGINDAPALRSATVGVSVSGRGDVAAEAAGVVVPDGSLVKVDEFLHISNRMRRIALQSAVGGMVLSIVGMGAAAAGLLVPLAGAIAQEIIDVFAVLNGLRAAMPPANLAHLRPLQTAARGADAPAGAATKTGATSSSAVALST